MLDSTIDISSKFMGWIPNRTIDKGDIINPCMTVVRRLLQVEEINY